MKLQVFLLEDAAARLEYDITFRNDWRGDPIDVVDIGLPHQRYSISNMSASIEGHALRGIRKSTYIGVGVEVPLGRYAIGPGERGTFKFQCTMPEMVFSDTTNKEFASFQIRPTWFDPNSQTGTTRLQVAIHLPPGITADEVRFQDKRQRYNELAYWGEGDQKHSVAIWESPEHSLSEQNPKFALSFPRRVMKRVITKSGWDLLLEWFGNRKDVQLTSGLSLVAGWAFLFFRFSHGTGCVVFVILAAALAATMLHSPALHLLTWPVTIGLIALNEWYLRRRKEGYLPAMATVEGGGIKRGLTAPQAGVLLEMPLGKILTMVVFGLLKKRVVRLTSVRPPAVEVEKEFRTTRKQRLERSARRGIVLHDYEHPFLDRLQTHAGAVKECDLNEALGKLVQSVADRMKGFDLQRTREYYRRLIQRAWKEAESIGQLRQRDQVVERNFEWMMMDPDWIEVFEDWGRRGYDYRPTWSWGGSSPQAPRPSPTPGSSPTLSEVAGSFAGWTENTASQLARAINPAAMGLDLPSGSGVLDLSGVDRLAADVFDALASSRGGGGGGGGCACACAGCACACACAGGGR
jgi:hypothetical protein